MLNEAKLQALILAVSGHPEVDQLGLTKLWKLIYFIDAAALRDTGSTLTGSEFIRYDHGPVPSRGEKSLKLLVKRQAVDIQQKPCGAYQLSHITAREAVPAGVLTSANHALVDRVCQQYGRMSAGYLSELSHREPAWICAAPLQKLEPVLIAYGSSEDPEGL